MEIQNPQHYFYLCDGGVLKNMPDFLNALKNMDETIFNFHVNQEKNDFFNWTKDILQEQNLAKKLSSLKTKEEVIQAVEQRLKNENKIQKKQKKKAVIGQIKEAIRCG